MRKTIHLLFLVFLLGACYFVQAQTTKQTTKKKTTQTTIKKNTATTKKTPAKKTAAKAGKVFICDGVNGYTYHSRRTCADLAKCKGRVLEMTKQEATGDWGRKQCKICY